MFNRNRIWALLGLVLLASACSDGESAVADSQVTVVATTTILGDLARNVVGPNAHVEVLIPVGSDPHDFQASARQVASIVSADLVVANGLGLEAGLDDVLLAASNDGANVVRIGELVDPQYFLGQDSSTEIDPHFWLDPLRMAEAARVLGEELAAISPDIEWATRAAAYSTELRDTDDEVRDLLAVVPADHRVLVTNHDSMGYFATRYGFTIVGVVVPGGSTLGEPSSAAVAALVAQIKSGRVPAIFAEAIDSSVLADAVAAEVGGDIEVVELYTGSLGEPGSEADTLIGMLLVNARRIAAALS